MADQNASRIAIRFGGASSKGPKTPSQNTSRPTTSTALGKRSRSGFDHDSDDDESEDDRHEAITHFGVNGAGNDDEVDDRPRDQSRSGDRHRRSQSKDSAANRGREEPAQSKNEDQDEEEPLKYGLVLSKKPKKETEKEGTAKEGADNNGSVMPKNADEEAIEALLDSGRKRTLHRTEDEAYRDATADAPEVDDVATYDAFPVEGFGEALLKGQGWDGEMRGPKAKEIKKRPNGIGLGAKKMTVEEDLGRWDSKGRTTEKRPRLDQYRSEKDKERSRREDRHRDSYKNERDRERDRDRDRDRHRDRHRDRDRDRDNYRHRDRDHRR